MSSNLRLKKFNKKLSYFSKHPYFTQVRDLYMNNIYKSVLQCEAKLNRLRITNKGKLYKTSQGLANAIDQMVINQFITTKHKTKIFAKKIFTHTIPETSQLDITRENIKPIEKQLSTILALHPVPVNQKINLCIHDTNKNLTICTAYVSSNQIVLKEMMTEYIRPKANAYQSNEFIISKVHICFMTVLKKSNTMGSSAHSIETAHEKYHVVNPTSKFNCIFQCVAVCRNFQHNKLLLEHTDEGSHMRITSGKKLKYDVQPSNENYGDESDIQQLANYTRYPINLYNNFFELIKTFTPLNPLARYKQLVKCYDIQQVGNHCKALIPKDIVKHIYPDFSFIILKSKKEEVGNEDVPIVKRRYFHTYNNKICTWDIETALNNNKEHIAYACSLAWREDGCLSEQQFWGLNCLQEMTTFMFDNKHIFHNATLYAHNGGKYDLNIAIKKAFIESQEFVIDGKKCIEMNNNWIGFTLMAKKDKKFKIYFKDSYQLLPMSLDKLTKELKVEHQKLTETVQHDQITLDNYMTFPQLKQYLTHDVYGLLEVIETFGQGIFDELGIDITKCFTGASLSKLNFFKNYYDSRYAVYKLSNAHDEFIRKGFYGGRNEAFQMGKIGKCYYYDFTSLYPDVGRLYLPYGKPEELDFENCNILPEDFFGFVQCKVRTKDITAIPKFGVVKDNKLIFPILENWTSMTLFSEEIDYDIYEYQFSNAMKFQKRKFLRRFFNDSFQRKAEAKANNNPAMCQAYKIIANSGYGFWSLKTKNRDAVLICNENDKSYLEYFNNDKLKDIYEHDSYTFARVAKDLETTDYNVGVGTAIASYARSKLHKLLTAIKQVGGKSFYCDTDSVICDINLNDYPHIKEEFQFDGTGIELGSLKNECDDCIMKKVANVDDFEALKANENGNFAFDKAIITGCKQYALYKTIEINNEKHDIDIVKLKGYSQKNEKIDFKQMENMYDDVKNIRQIQTQFRCPKSNFVSETKQFTIQTQQVPKTFKTIYTKGHVDNITNVITPLRI